MFSHIQTKLIVLYTVLFILVQGITYGAVYDTTVENLTEQIKQQLVFGQRVVKDQITAKIDDLTEASTVLAADFGFRTAVATDDVPTIQSALENLRQRIDAANAKLVSLEGDVLADTDPTFNQNGDLDDLMALLLDRAEFDNQPATIMSLNGVLQEFIMVPILAPIPIAYIGLGVEIDQQALSDFTSALPAGIALSFVEKSDKGDVRGSQAALISTTLKPESQDDLIANLKSPASAEQEPSFITLGGEEFVTLDFAIDRALDNQNLFIKLQYSLDDALAPYQPLVLSLSFLVAVGLVFLIVGSIFIARSVTSPISDLSSAAKKIGEGVYQPVKEYKQGDEVAQLATSFNQMIGDIQAREEKIRYQAEHDQETNLSNRTYFERRLREQIYALPDTKQISVFVLSINRFEEIQNTLGYNAGERLIVHVSERLSEVAKEANIIARLTTTSFILSLVHGADDQAVQLGHFMKQQLEETYSDESCSIDVSVSIGITQWSPIKDREEGASTNQHSYVDALIRQANIACLQDHDSLSDFTFYDVEKDLHDTERLSLISELKEALAKHEIQLFYQPKINLTSNRITHVETLVRWFHPERGFMNPETFIALAEQTGHVHLLTDYVLRGSMAQCAAWHDEGYDIVVAINLSARDLLNDELPDQIATMMKDFNIKPEWLVLEVTESAVMSDPTKALGVLHKLSDLGIILSIDDYGTGYSSMAYLKTLPVQELKIDKSFVLKLASDEQDQVLVRSTIQLAQSLRLKVTAEGVEDQKTYEMLRDMGCDLAQGYYMSKPLPVNELNDFIRKSDYAISD